MFQKVLVANRGAVAARIIRTLRALGIRSVAVYSEADADAPYLAEADTAIPIGPAPARASYLNPEALLDAVRRSGADALHPGYGFLAESSGFAWRVQDLGVRFIGPSPRWIELMAHKVRAREVAAALGLPIVRGSGVLSGDVGEMRAAAASVGFPVLVKPVAGGGGLGMHVAHCERELVDAVASASSLAYRLFGNWEVYLEQLLPRPRHIEFQILGDRFGAVRPLFERDCSVQRRHQKIIGESPVPAAAAPGGSEDHGPALADLAVRIASTLARLGYDNIGTVETLVDADGTVRFLEMNARLQVEHGVTEAVTGIDLVAAQIRSAAGEDLGSILPRPVAVRGHAIEARVYAEDPETLLPSPGTLTEFRLPCGPGVLVETGYAEGSELTPHYDSLLAKVVVHGADRADAIGRLRDALAGFAVAGVRTNLPLLLSVLRSERFHSGQLDTGLVGDLRAAAAARMAPVPGGGGPHWRSDGVSEGLPSP
jgi:acetyl-CoA carboxylase biotin carboxylase subunit